MWGPHRNPSVLATKEQTYPFRLMLVILGISTCSRKATCEERGDTTQVDQGMFRADSGCPPAGVSSSRQSPVDISGYEARDDCGDLSFYGYNDAKYPLRMKNTGKTVKIDNDKRSMLLGGPLTDVYRFKQMHFHWGLDSSSGSEHTIDGKRFALEIHLVHYNSKYSSLKNAMRHEDGIAVVAVLVEEVQDTSESLAGITSSLISITDSSSEIEVSPQFLQFLRPVFESKEYYLYNGSLTTPPFCENVQWIIFQHAARVWSENVQLFHTLKSANETPILSNVRSPQALNNRLIVFCRGGAGSSYPSWTLTETSSAAADAATAAAPDPPQDDATQPPPPEELLPPPPLPPPVLVPLPPPAEILPFPEPPLPPPELPMLPFPPPLPEPPLLPGIADIWPLPGAFDNDLYVDNWDL